MIQAEGKLHFLAVVSELIINTCTEKPDVITSSHQAIFITTSAAYEKGYKISCLLSTFNFG